MTLEDGHFELPGKIDGYLAALSRLYEKKNNAILQNIVVNGAPSIHEDWSYDNLDGGTYGHALTLTLGEELFLEIVDNKKQLGKRICADIGELDNSTKYEFISEVFIEMEPVEDDQWRENSGILRPRIAASSLHTNDRQLRTPRMYIFLSRTEAALPIGICST